MAAEPNGKLEPDQVEDFADGYFFCNTADVWAVDRRKPLPEHWDAFWRKPGDVSINFGQDDENSHILDQYAISRNAMHAGSTPAPVKSTRSESSGGEAGNKKQIIWPVDIAGNPFTPYQDIAHLLPAGKHAHEEWFGVAGAVLGLPKTASILEQLMATRGVKKECTQDHDDDSDAGEPAAASATTDNTTPAEKKERPKRGAASNPPPKKRSRRRAAADSARNESGHAAARGAQPAKRSAGREAAPSVKKGGKRKSALKQPPEADQAKTQRRTSFDETTISQDSASTETSAARKQRIDHTGVVHFVFNKLRLQQQRNVFDGNKPLMLIVPCMTLEEANSWRGEGYTVVVLTGFPHGIANIPQEYADAYSNVDGKKMACEAFKQADMGNRDFRKRYENSDRICQEEKADLLQKARMGLEEAVLGLTEYVKGLKEKDLSDLQDETQKRLKERSRLLSGIEVPVPKSLPVPEKPVLFLKFGSLGQSNAHPAPDPELLLAKAATVWGVLNGVSILANGQLDQDCNSLDEAAEEYFCASFRSSMPQIPKEISVVSPECLSITRR